MQNLKSKKGITLIELIVAISLLTLVIMAGSGIYLSGWNMFRNAQVYAQAQRNAMIPMAHMVKNLQNAVVFTRVSDTVLQFTEITDITTAPPTTATRSYTFSGGSIQYDSTVIGTHIRSFSYTISPNSIVVNITITATDNNGNNPYTLTSTVEARYGATPPV